MNEPRETDRSLLRPGSRTGQAQVDGPLVGDQRRNELETGAAVGPVDGSWIAGGARAEAIAMRDDADPAQVEAVGVPAGLNRDVRMSSLMGVARAGSMQQPEVFVGQLEQLASQRGGEFGSPRTVLWVRAFIHAFGVVKHGKQRHDLDLGTGDRAESPAVLQDPRPMRHAMNAVKRQRVLREDGTHDGF